MISTICAAIYIVSNPILYALTMIEMRMHYYKGVKTNCCCCIKQNRIDDVNVMTVNRESQCTVDVNEITINRVTEI